jgi:squalene synthase HpnC
MPPAIIQQLETYGPHQCAQLDYADADAYTRQLARSHYENFTVVSWLLPRRLQAHFHHIYAFCRWADDLGDEAGSPARSLELLTWWRTELDRCYVGQPRHPVFVALRPTIDRYEIPRQPFDDLIDAFVQDQRLQRYETFAQTLDYCTRSANPVGRLVLYLCGYRDTQRQTLSDATCTALQLANFWQDVRRDVLERNRVYIPAEVAAAHGLDIPTLVSAIRADAGAGTCPDGCCTRLPSAGITALLPAYRATIRDLVDQTAPLFIRGRELWPLLDRSVRVDIELFTRGGESILQMIRNQDYDTLSRRPSLSKPAKLALLGRALLGRLSSCCAMGRRTDGPSTGASGGPA